MTWEMLWAVGRYDLRLTEEEFWHMVPRQFAALLERRRFERIQLEHGPALIVATLLSVFGAKKKPKITDYMPSWKDKPKKETSWQDQLEMVKQLHVAFGGR